MSKKYVKLGHYKLYRYSTYEDVRHVDPWSDEPPKAVVVTAWVGPATDGDRIELLRYVDKETGWVEWELHIMPQTHDGILGDISLSWCGSAKNHSPAVACEMAWQFIEGMAGLYVGVEGWTDE